MRVGWMQVLEWMQVLKDGRLILKQQITPNKPETPKFGSLRITMEGGPPPVVLKQWPGGGSDPLLPLPQGSPHIPRRGPAPAAGPAAAGAGPGRSGPDPPPASVTVPLSPRANGRGERQS